MFKGSQSRQFSRRAANAQRDMTTIVVKQQYGFKVEVGAENSRFSFQFNPLLNLIASGKFKTYAELYDQFRCQGITMKFVPNIVNNAESYTIGYRWFRDGCPYGESTEDRCLELEGYTKPYVFYVDERVDLLSAGSSNIKRITPNYQSNIYSSIYASSIQEKSKYINTFEALDKRDNSLAA